MIQPVPFADIWRGSYLESQHFGHAVICDDTGQIVESWGDPDAIVLPRSSAKMIQALPLLESGAADRFHLTPEQLALCCASHQGDLVHTDRVSAWLSDLGLTERALRCGPQPSGDRNRREEMIRADQAPCQLHNNCSGKHAGFLTLAKDMGATDPEYVDPDHIIQKTIGDAWSRMTEEDLSTPAIDGCSAPNYPNSLVALARAMAKFASAPSQSPQSRLIDAMMTHPELVAGKGRACTELMHALEGRAVVKTGAEGVFVAVLPGKRMGVALKIADGATRASEIAITAILVHLGVLERGHPTVRKYLDAEIRNWRGTVTGFRRVNPALLSI